MKSQPELILPSGQENRQFGIRSLIEQLGNEALNIPTNTLYRYEDGYNSTLGRLLLFVDGDLKDTTSGDYTETDGRLITMAAGLADAARLLGIVFGLNVGFGGLADVDRPPAGAGVGPYTTSVNFVNASELFVWDNEILQIDGALLDYQSTIPNLFTFNAPPTTPIVAAIIRLGAQGLDFRETFLNQGPFPAVITTVGTLDKIQKTTLVFLNGSLLSENVDYVITGPNSVSITLTLAGAIHSVVVVSLAASIPPKWRQ